MSGYLLTLLGIVLLGVLIEVILPPGTTSKYISGIFSIFVMFVILSPILTWIRSDYKLSDYFTKTDIQLNEKLLYNINNSKLSEIEQVIIEELNTN